MENLAEALQSVFPFEAFHYRRRGMASLLCCLAFGTELGAYTHLFRLHAQVFRIGLSSSGLYTNFSKG